MIVKQNNHDTHGWLHHSGSCTTFLFKLDENDDVGLLSTVLININ